MQALYSIKDRTWFYRVFLEVPSRISLDAPLQVSPGVLRGGLTCNRGFVTSGEIPE